MTTVSTAPDRATAPEEGASIDRSAYTTVMLYDRRDTEYMAGADGQLKRSVGSVAIDDERSQFRLLFHRGAYEDDERALQEVVSQLRAGAVDVSSWDTIKSEARPGAIYLASQFGVPADKRTDRRIIRCTTSECEQHGGHHYGEDADDVTHWGESINRGDLYRLELAKNGAGPWKISLDVQGDIGESDAANFLNDFSWLRAAAARLNGSSTC